MSHTAFTSEFPPTATDLLRGGNEWWAALRLLKDRLRPADFDWYPFESLTALPVITELLEPVYSEIAETLLAEPLLDIGCADGDLSMLFARYGVEVDAIDCASTNFNRMQGVELLSRDLGLPVCVHDVDVDARFEFPRDRYGLTLFLGTLYHLKNPYYVLEKLAYETKWCLLSTRIAQVTPRVGARIEDEPMAYLADGQEIDNDATNYWIFSAFGLLRILQRTRWAIRGIRRVGCASDSDPIHSSADERMFVLAQSRVHYPQLAVRPLTGWYDPEGHSWCWTAKRFAIEVVLPLEQACSAFRFKIFVPDAIVHSSGAPIVISCRMKEQLCGTLSCEHAGDHELSGMIPPFALHEPLLQVDFEVTGTFAEGGGDERNLGICVPLLGDSGQASQIPFTVY